MRRNIFVMCVAALAFMFSACTGGVQNEAGEEKSLYDHGIEVISLLDEMIRDDTYGQMMSGSSEIQTVADEIKTGNYTTPQAVYKISVPEDIISSILTVAGGDTSMISEMSEALQADLNKRMLSSISSQINSMQGVTYLAASSLYTADKTFVSHETEEDTIYLYTFENGFPVMVTFHPGEDGSMTAHAVFLLDENLASAAEQDIEELLGTVYILSGCEIERYTQD